MHDSVAIAIAVAAVLAPLGVWAIGLLLNIRDRLSRIEGYLWPVGELRRSIHPND